MIHPIYRVVSFKIVAPYTLQVMFDDQTSQIIDFTPILKGALYGPLVNQSLFEQVKIDPEVHTIVWPNGADFDPADLHDWPMYKENFEMLAKQWSLKSA